MQGEPSAKRAYGSGSIVERRGSYYGKWRAEGRQVWRLLGRKRCRGESDGLTRAQAEARLRELMTAHTKQLSAEAARAPVQPGRTIARLAAAYLEYAREHRGLKSTTLADYESAVRIHLEPFFGDTAVEMIDAAQVEAFVAHLRKKTGQGHRGGRPLSPKTIDNYVGVLVVLLNFAVRKKWILSSPMSGVDLPKPKGDDPLPGLTFLEPHEVARLIAKAQPGDYHDLDRALGVTP